MSAIIRLRIDAVDMAHGDAEIRVQRLHEKMIMIVHQNKGVDDEIETITNRLDYVQKHLAIEVVAMDPPPRISS